MRKAAIELQDAEEAPWKREKRPDPTPAEIALKAAAMEFTAAKLDLEGPVGPETNAKALKLREASQALCNAAIALAQETPK